MSQSRNGRPKVYNKSKRARSFKSNDNKSGRAKIMQQRKDAKHPFKKPAAASIKITNHKDKLSASSKSKSKYKYVKPNHPLSKKDLRERKRERKSHKANGTLRSELNFLASSHQNAGIRLSKRSKKDQKEFVDRLLTKMKGNILSIISKIDSTRTIQTAIKYGSQSQILSICKELKGHFIDLSGDHYAHKTVRALLEYGRDEVRQIIISELMKAITRLILHRLASSVVDYAIMIIADERVKRLAFQYFISPKFILTPQYIDNNEQNLPKTIDEILICSEESERNSIIRQMEKFLICGFEKDIMSTGIFEVVLFHYLHHIKDEKNKKKCEQMIELLLPHIMQIQNVKEGVMAVCEVINYAVFLKPKFRKNIVKKMSDFVVTMCCDKSSYLIICRLLDVYDDTNLLNRMVLTKVINHLHILFYHDYGRLVLFHLLCPRNERYFGRNKLYEMICTKPRTITEYEASKGTEDENGDNVMSENGFVDPSKMANCKKDYAIKRVQLLKKLLPKMIDFCVENVKKLVCHDLAGPIFIELIRLLVENENESIKEMKSKKDALIDAVVNAAILDTMPREISPTPPMPEEPVFNDEVEVNNIVDDSFKIIEDKKAEKESANMTLANVDITKMDPLTAKNVLKLQQIEQMKKNDAEFMKMNALYEIEMICYQLAVNRHRKNVKAEDEKYGLMEHRLGHRRLRKMVEDFEDVRVRMFDALCGLNEEQWTHFVEVKGVYVIWELYNCGNQMMKNKMTEILTPICNKLKVVFGGENESNKGHQGLRKLCVALNIDL